MLSCFTTTSWTTFLCCDRPHKTGSLLSVSKPVVSQSYLFRFAAMLEEKGALSRVETMRISWSGVAWPSGSAGPNFSTDGLPVTREQSPKCQGRSYQSLPKRGFFASGISAMRCASHLKCCGVFSLSQSERQPPKKSWLATKRASEVHLK